MIILRYIANLPFTSARDASSGRPCYPYSVAFTANGQMAATIGQDWWGGDGTVRIWAAPECNEVRSMPVSRYRPARFQMALSPDGNKLMVNQDTCLTWKSRLKGNVAE